MQMEDTQDIDYVTFGACGVVVVANVHPMNFFLAHSVVNNKNLKVLIGDFLCG